MYFLSINKIKQGADPGALGMVIPRHIQWIKKEIAASTIVQAGKWGDSGGMAVIRAKDISEARSILNNDPLVQSGLISFEMAQFFPDVEIR